MICDKCGLTTEDNEICLSYDIEIQKDNTIREIYERGFYCQKCLIKFLHHIEKKLEAFELGELFGNWHRANIGKARYQKRELNKKQQMLEGLERASRIVDSWPEWKKNQLGRYR